jgi:hypothetical protein
VIGTALPGALLGLLAGLAEPGPAGRYVDAEGPDVAAELVLGADGRFAFGLAAGALDASAEGRWTGAGDGIVLNTEPRPRPPSFAPGPVGRVAGVPIQVLVQRSDGSGIAGIDVRVGLAGGQVLEGYTQEYGWTPSRAAPSGLPRWVELSLDWYGIPAKRFPVDAAAGNSFAFILIPNDIGIHDFRDAPGKVTADGLVLSFRGGWLRFRRSP